MKSNMVARFPVSTKFMMIILPLFCVFLLAGTQPGKLQAGTTPTPGPMVTLHGRVTSQDGKGLHALISVSELDNHPLGDVQSDQAGNYTIRIPQRSEYLLYAQELDGRVQFGADVIPTGYLDQYQVVTPIGDEVMANFSLLAGGSIWLKTYDLSGNYLFRQDVNQNNWTVGIYPLGTAPTTHPMQYLNHQINTFWGWRNGSDKNNTVLLTQAGQAVELWIYFHVAQVGNTYIHLDNDGKGYIVKQGEVIQVNFLYDAARTEYRIYQQKMTNYLAAGYTFSQDISDWNATAAQVVETMTQACQAGNFAGCMVGANTVLTRTIRSREDALLQMAQQDIEKYRKGDISVKIRNCAGAPASGVTVNYQQNTQDFIFGVGWPDAGQLNLLKQAGFNGAIQEAWWGEILSANGDFQYRDNLFAPFTQQGLKILMHTGVWITPDRRFVLSNIDSLTPDQIAETAREFSAQVTAHYRDQMDIYNAFNEPQNTFYTLPLTLTDVVNIAAASVEGAGQGAPDVPTYINFYYTYLGDMSWYVNPANQTYPAPEEILKALLARNIPFDNIGLEFYNSPSLDFGIYNDTIEHYSQFGKSIFVSELSYSGNWRDETTDQAPAEWAKYAYTIAFSKPYVSGVTWIPGDSSNSPAYLFGADGNPRPVLETIGNLIHSWTSAGNGTTDNQGKLTWRGFFGDYTITWTGPDGEHETASVHVRQNAQNNFDLQPTACALAAAPTPTTAAAELPANTRKTTGYKGLSWLAGIAIVLGIGIAIVLLVLGIRLFKSRAR